MSIHAANQTIPETAETARIDPNGHPTGQGPAKSQVDPTSLLAGRKAPRTRFGAFLQDNRATLLLVGVALAFDAFLTWGR